MSDGTSDFETGFNETGVNLRENVFRVNRKMPRPCALSHDAIRKVALAKWATRLVRYTEMVAWLADGAPDKNGTLYCPSTRKPPLPGQGTDDPNRMANALIEARVFLDHHLIPEFESVGPQARLEVLAFDVGDDIVGVLDVNTGGYTPYRGDRIAEGAQRIIDCRGVIVSYNGDLYDLPKLAEFLGTDIEYRGTHYDMLTITLNDRRDVDPLRETYEHYFDDEDAIPRPPPSVKDDYEKDNWEDCWLAAELWKMLCAPALAVPASGTES